MKPLTSILLRIYFYVYINTDYEKFLSRLIIKPHTFFFTDEMVHSVNISKPKYVFMSTDTYNNYYETIRNTNIVEKFFAFGNAVSDPKLTSFDELSKTHVDVESFIPPTDSNGKKQMDIHIPCFDRRFKEMEFM